MVELDASVERVTKIVFACIVLHNVCQLMDEEFDEELLEAFADEEGCEAGPDPEWAEHQSRARSFRETFVEYFEQVQV